MTYEEVAKETGCSPRSVGPKMKAMLEAGDLEVAGARRLNGIILRLAVNTLVPKQRPCGVGYTMFCLRCLRQYEWETSLTMCGLCENA
mgnify:CR=1 FL=1